MELAFHGGNCCGIKCIYHLPMYPNRPVGPRKRESLDVFYDEKSAYPSNASKQTPCDAERPNETGIQRLDFYLAWLQEHRPGSIVEMTLSSWQFDAWESVLLERGFKVVAEFINSNSWAKVKVYHKLFAAEEPTVDEDDDIFFDDDFEL